MNDNESVMRRKTVAMGANEKMAYRLTNSMITFVEQDLEIFSIIITQIKGNEIFDEAILLNVCTSQIQALKLFDEISENLVFPCVAQEIFEELYEKYM